MLETITCEGLPPIKSITINISAEEAVRTAQLECVIIGPGVPVSIGQAVSINASGTLILTGYVRDINTGYSDRDRTLTVSLMSRTVDYVECSADHPTGEFIDKDLATIARELDGMGIGVETSGTFPKEARHKLMIGQAPFSSIERVARARGQLIYDTPKGRLKLASRPEGRHAGSLKRGVHILPGASASFTERDRYSEVRMRGQMTEGTDKQQLRPQTIARDSGVTRKRVLILGQEGEATIDRMKTRAVWQAKRAAGNGTTASLPVTGWRDAGGKIWSPNYLVDVNDDWLGIEGQMIIKGVTLEQNDQAGTVATLSLADPRALGGENPRSRTSKSYAAPGAIQAEYEDE